MDLRNLLAKDMAGSQNKILSGKCMGNITPDLEWIKWLSYEPDFLKRRKEYLRKKEFDQLSLKELSEVNRYLLEEEMVNLFKLYGTSFITKSEYLKVYQFMTENKIEKYMIKKLSKKEKEYAKTEIQYYSQAPLEELEEKIKFETKINHYQDLSMVDAFILHFIVKIYYQIEDVKINKEINSQIKANETMHQKGLHYAKHSVVKK